MFTLVNKWGNVYKNVNTEREKGELIKQGYREEKDEISFDKMKVEQLDEYAKEHNIDLSDCKNKAEKLERIKSFVAE